MSPYTSATWGARYAPHVGVALDVEHPTLAGAFDATVARSPEAVAIRYFDGTITFAELDARAAALAAALQDHGFAPGDRLALYTQNNPAFVVGLLAAWKAGGAAVAVNPMNRYRELTYLLADSGAVALLCLDDLYRDVAAEVIASGETRVATVITTSPLEDQSRGDERVLGGVEPIHDDGVLELAEVLARYRGRGPDAVRAAEPDDLAILTYTSGTTGVPKGAMNTQHNLAHNAQVYRDWVRLDAGDSVLGVAPLFHITGLVAHIGVAVYVGIPLVLAHRFEPGVVLDAIREHRPTFTIGALTVFIALLAAGGDNEQDWASFRAILSGGAPIAPAVNQRFEDATGHYIHNAYGLTETSSPSHLVPIGVRAPVDPASGALSVGVPVCNTVVRILTDDGEEAAVGEIGEIATSGPQVVGEYWGKPEATAQSIPGGELRTGDVGFMDADGWFYIVDRKKDMINAAGYKVWPREVEDVLYGHPAVNEAAVVGIPDEYRGETVKAVVTLKSGAAATPQEIQRFAKENLAAYKYPRIVEIVEELPKTTTGKILRRELR